MEEKCRKCGKTLFKKVLLDEQGHTAIDESTPISLESDDKESFFKCPHCLAKNIVVSSTSQYGVPQLRISHVKE